MTERPRLVMPIVWMTPLGLLLVVLAFRAAPIHWLPLALAATAVLQARLAREADPRAKSQLLILRFGLVGAYAPMLLLDVVPRALLGPPPPVLGALGQAAWSLLPLSILAAVAKRRLFALPAAVKRLAVYAALAAGLAATYTTAAAVLRALGDALAGVPHAPDLAGVGAIAVTAAVFTPLRAGVWAIADHLFFRTRYDFASIVDSINATARGTLDVEVMKTTFMAAIDAALHPRYVYILTCVPQGDMFVTMGESATWGDPPVPALKVGFDDPLLARAGSGEELQYEPGAGATARLSPLAALGRHYRLPLQVGDETVGVVILGPKRTAAGYSASDMRLLRAVRQPLATALKTAALLDDKLFKDRIEQELKRARAVQEALLPRQLPRLAGFDFAASSRPCHEASGDYYDFLALPDGRLAVAVADVAGKGIAAALATAMAKSGLYNQVETDPEVVPVLAALNRLIHHTSHHAAAKSFTTCLYALLDPRTRRLTYACAGHFPPLHWSAARGGVTPLPLAGGFPLGVRAQARYTARDVELAPGDVVVLYTDGVTEARRPAAPGEPFESERLAEVVGRNCDRTAGEIHDAIVAAVAAYTAGAPLDDDLTLIVLKAD